MTQKINDIQKETIKDVQKKLKEHHKCLLVRPTGFGKTKTAVDIMNKYKHAVFLYPNNNIANAVKNYDIGNLDLTLYSYNGLCRMYKKMSYKAFKEAFEKYNLKNTIFVMDEAHFIGAPTTAIIIEKLMKEICPNANFLGMTATPNRTDKLEIKWHFFDGITAFEYGIGDAFKDDIYVKPYYVFTPLNGNNLEEKLISQINSLEISSAKKDQLKSRVKKNINPQKLNIENLDEIIENNLYKFKNNIDYYKFILFFSTFDDIHRKRNEIESAFSKVFPNCEINIIIVSSENTRYRLNLESIDNLVRRENTIDLIFNVNMLTFGYHVADITGIMMFRQTISNIIYSQQVGRCLSVIQKEASIIFDFVENLFKGGYNSVVEIEERSPGNGITGSLTLLLPIDDIILDDLYKELLEIDRLINNAITEEFEEEVVSAYRNDLIDIDYAINKLQLHSEQDFMKILERYENANKTM